MSFKFGSSAGGTGSNSGGGGGLYAGIALGGKKNPEEPTPTSLDPRPEASNADKTKSDINQEVVEATREGTSAEPEKSKGPPLPLLDIVAIQTLASSWSSSLRFAPVIRKPAVKSSTSKPFAVPFANLTGSKSTSTASAFAPDEDEEPATSNPNPRTMHIPGRAKVALTAAPVNAGPSKAPSVFARKGGFLAAHAPERIPGGPSFNPTNPASTAPSLKDKVDSGIPGLQHSLPAILAQTTTLKGLVPTLPGSAPKFLKRKLDQPPPLTLPDEELGGGGGGGDVNGFGQSEIGRKMALRAARMSKKNKKKGKAREVDPAILFLEDYDPARPNDYTEWMNFTKRRREQRREALRLEREHQRRKEREELTESSVYSSDDDASVSDDAPAPAKGKFFAPPSDYNAPRPDDPDVASTAGSSMVEPRRQTGDDAYARRVALSQGVPYSQPLPSSNTADVSVSGTAPPSDSVPTGFPSVSIAEAQARAKSIAERLQHLREEGEQDPAAAPTAGPVVPPPLRPTATLEEAQAKARLIAAKLAALSGGGGPIATTEMAAAAPQPSGSNAEGSQAPNESGNKAPGQPDFARRLMDKYGWKEGQGLGASESGRTSILTVAAAPAHSGKKNKHTSEIGPGPVPTIGKGRGVVIDEAKAQRDREEKERYGEPTRVVYLTNVVAVDEVDDELSHEIGLLEFLKPCEPLTRPDLVSFPTLSFLILTLLLTLYVFRKSIAEEAGKHGIVERCFVRIVQKPLDDPSEAVRVFIIFSGLVGAWKAVKTFDGRFFGGRTIRASVLYVTSVIL
ncbi:uncharacterized protein MELLADRAFT_93872 [Melampsora larici-populina 98AG31]|uniref:G-patch domain-containing protein n=1 Tax=Melampsora larici-populina (strain 98AG31 / pathotype 3-4-7) TaxID=747676 RepID=F4S5K5_MELLP|nr:uncharacterized protein MELLADRAFT_93872 [Melampsora larici-populina 98AG31]EGG00042.1 hypothetical protein MELLADRAFT_93872 [Melampsora larici-populina 98AG31]